MITGRVRNEKKERKKLHRKYFHKNFKIFLKARVKSQKGWWNLSLVGGRQKKLSRSEKTFVFLKALRPKSFVISFLIRPLYNLLKKLNLQKLLEIVSKNSYIHSAKVQSKQEEQKSIEKLC